MSVSTSIKQYAKAYDKAVEFFNLFEDAGPGELLPYQEALADECEKFLQASGLEWNDAGNLGRHLTFLKYYLDRGDKGSCSQDIRDIVFWDLPTGLRSLAEQADEYSQYDARLRDGVVPLIDGGYYDSAIRKVFVLLTDRLRRAFGVADELDGDDLVNLVFGRGGKIPVALGDSQKQAMRNLISGFYGVYRNNVAHNDVKPTVHQAKALLEMANTIIQDIEDLAKRSVGQA